VNTSRSAIKRQSSGLRHAEWLLQQSSRLIAVPLLLFTIPLCAQDLTYAAQRSECLPTEPDSVQVSWSAPCVEDDWLLDTEAGCRMWDWHPDANDRELWTGECRAGMKEGAGTVQWFEHGGPIDRFEGIFRAGGREGLGHYTWNVSNWFTGTYAGNRPHGLGTALIAGVVFKGPWQNGCSRNGDKVVAIGVPLTSCTVLDIFDASTIRER